MPGISRLAVDTVAYFNILLISAFVLVIIMYIYNYLHRKSPVCPVADFPKSSKLVILVSDKYSIDILPGDPDFDFIVNSFEDDFYESKESASVPIVFIIHGKRYTITVSDVGWNFKGEAHNCRKIKDPLELAIRINSRIEKIIKK